MLRGQKVEKVSEEADGTLLVYFIGNARVYGPA